MQGGIMYKNMSIKAGLLTWLVLMTVILFIVSGISINTIRQSSHFLQSTNQVQGEELGSLNRAYTASLRARTEATLAVRQLETGLIEEAQASTANAKALAKQANESMAAFLAVGATTQEGAKRAQQLNVAYQNYTEQGVN